MRCPYCGRRNIAGVDLCGSCGSELAGLDTNEAAGGFRGHLLTDSLGELTMEEALVVHPSDSVATAVENMQKAQQGSTQVMHRDRLIGIFTERDLLIRVLLPGLDPRTTRVEDVMTGDPYTLRQEDPPVFAVHRMVGEGLRHLPVVDDDQVMGVVTVRNVLAYIHELIREA